GGRWPCRSSYLLMMALLACATGSRWLLPAARRSCRQVSHRTSRDRPARIFARQPPTSLRRQSMSCASPPYLVVLMRYARWRHALEQGPNFTKGKTEKRKKRRKISLLFSASFVGTNVGTERNIHSATPAASTWHSPRKQRPTN